MRGGITTGDPLNDLRLAELRAFATVRDCLHRLADVPLHDRRRRNTRRHRLDVAKIKWWASLQARDAAESIQPPPAGRRQTL